MNLSKEQWTAWREDPVTAAFFDWVESKREELKEQWAGGAFSGPSIEELAIRNAAATGAASAYDEVIELDYEQLTGDLHETES